MTFTYLTGSNGLEWTDGSICEEPGSPDRPGDPGGQVLVAQAGLAGPGEHLDVPGLGVADVHHGGARWGCPAGTAGVGGREGWGWAGPPEAPAGRAGAHAGSRLGWPSLATGSPVTRFLRRGRE